MGTIFVGKKLGLEAIRPIQLLSGTIAPILLLLDFSSKFWMVAACFMGLPCSKDGMGLLTGDIVILFPK